MGIYWLITAIIIGAIFTYLNNQKKFVDSFYKNHSDEQLAKEIILILNKILDFHDKNSNFIYSGFENYDDFKQEIDYYNNALNKNDYDSIYKLSTKFAPTASFQELSMVNNWHNDYLILSNRFDIIYNILKERLEKHS